jgi:hypothetical protein
MNSAPRDRELDQRTDEVLHYLWDPIGAAGVPSARDEYDSYLPKLLSLLNQGATHIEVAGYLITIEEEQMGLRPNLARASEVAEILLAHREWIEHNAS